MNVSIKPTALATHYEPLSRREGIESAKERIRPILRMARERDAHVHFDMEHYDAKDLTLALFRDLLSEDEFADVAAGIVIQAYLRDSRDDLADLIAWSAGRARPDHACAWSRAPTGTPRPCTPGPAGGRPPVFEDKDETDANYERCARLLHDHHGEVRAAFGSHNLRSLAYAVSYARHRGVPDHGYEIQLLYGMAEPVHAAIKRLGLRLRVYGPVGELVPGMAYLVRRLLENTSNESFVRHRFAEGRALDELVAPPAVDEIPGPTAAAGRPRDRPEPAEPPTSPSRCGSGGGGRPGPRSAWPSTRRATTPGIEVPALIDGERVRTDQPRSRRSIPPRSTGSSPPRRRAPRPTPTGPSPRRWPPRPAWRAAPAVERAALLFRAAQWMRERRDELAALECFEAAKPWDQADADVCEAIDFCEYYGREVLRLDAARADLVQSPPGEANRLTYQGKGVTAVIAPWNFPLAIPCGMTVAALAAGNPVILKPAEQTPAVAWRLAEALVAAGAAPGVFQLLPGLGEEVGARLVEHPDVAVIAFTGSKAGRACTSTRSRPRPQPGQRHLKKVVCELGGKNALIIDDDADPDQAVPAAAYSAFGYAGQKCSAASRLIVLDRTYDAVVARLVGCSVGAARSATRRRPGCRWAR